MQESGTDGRHENTSGSASAPAEPRARNSRGLNELVTLLSAHRCHLTSPWRPLHCTCMRPSHSPRPTLRKGSPLTEPLAQPSSSPAVHIWGNPTAYPITGQTPGIVLTHPTSLPVPSPGLLSSLCHSFLSNILPDLSLPIPVCPRTALEGHPAPSTSHGSPVPSGPELLGLAPGDCSHSSR